MKLNKSFLIIIGLLIVSTACSVDDLPLTQSRTPLSTRVPGPSPSREQPSATLVSPTQTRTSTPTLVTPRPTQTETRVSHLPSLFVFPAIEPKIAFPPPSPSSPASDYQLRSWSETEGLSLIAEVNSIFHANEGGGRRWFLQQYLILAEREYLLRFPDSTLSPPLEWELAYRESISFYSDHVNTFRNLLEEVLNTGHVQLSSLDAWLIPRGFKLAGTLEAPNFYGDEQAVTILHIEAIDIGWSTHSAVFVVQEQDDGSYQVAAVREQWLEYNPTTGGGDETISIDDLNGNGRSEVISIENAWGHAACTTELSIYEWQGDRSEGDIVNLAQLVPRQLGDYLNSDCDEVWKFESGDVRGEKTILAIPGLSGPTTGGCPYERPSWTRFGWTGSFFEWEAEAKDTRLPVEGCAPWGAVKETLAGLAFATETEAIEAMREAGLRVWAAETGDLTGDGSQDLLILIDSDDFSGDYELWALIHDRGNSIPIQLPHRYYEPDSYYSTLQVCYPDPNGSQVNVFSLGEQDFIFQIDEFSDGYHMQPLVLSSDSYENLPASAYSSPPLVEQCGLPDSYLWDPITRRLYRDRSHLKTDLDEIEHVFFTLGDLEKSIGELRAFQVGATSYQLGYFADEEEAKVQYLLALADELSGREREAVEHYYHSWQLDQEGLMGWMASRKLIRKDS